VFKLSDVSVNNVVCILSEFSLNNLVCKLSEFSANNSVCKRSELSVNLPKLLDRKRRLLQFLRRLDDLLEIEKY
jgi:hypothetical protein